MNHLTFLETAVSAVQAAGELLRAGASQVRQVDEMLDHDIKLRLDADCQKLITEKVLAAFPDHSVFGEEGGSAYGETEYQWIVDPLDGTVNYFYDFPHYCSTLALQFQKKTIVGATYDPVRNELFTVTVDGPALLNGRPIQASQRNRLIDAMISTGFSKFKSHVESGVERIRYLGMNAKKVRMNGCAALDMAYVACGRLDAYIESGVRLWDIAAGALMIEQAGGKVELTESTETPMLYKMTASSGKIELPG